MKRGAAFKMKGKKSMMNSKKKRVGERDGAKENRETEKEKERERGV